MFRPLYINLLLLTVMIGGPLIALGAPGDYVPLVQGGVPGLDTQPTNIEQYINILYVLSIGLASALAVIKIIMGGVQYMLSDIVTDKAEAKKSITGALLGLILILGAVTILNTINTNLTNFSIFNDHVNFVLDAPTPTFTTTYEASHPSAYLAAKDQLRQQCLDSGGVPGSFHYEGAISITGTNTIKLDCNTKPLTGVTSCPEGQTLHKEVMLEEIRRYCVNETGGGPSSCDGYFNPQNNTCYSNEQEVPVEGEYEWQREDACNLIPGTEFTDDGRCVVRRD